ncbi:unnamed protein product [Cuscuta campestris]|uniref:Uncharacterized protein n=1 Tax=Cuscuta campestris TaxID=132261 RepID=A0A484LJT5_9ASTE|nr:unnamed protein product [Cuscuta campestris]
MGHVSHSSIPSVSICAGEVGTGPSASPLPVASTSVAVRLLDPSSLVAGCIDLLHRSAAGVVGHRSPVRNLSLLRSSACRGHRNFTDRWERKIVAPASASSVICKTFPGELENSFEDETPGILPPPDLDAIAAGLPFRGLDRDM